MSNLKNIKSFLTNILGMTQEKPNMSIVNEYIKNQDFQKIKNEIDNGYIFTEKQEKEYINQLSSLLKEKGEEFLKEIKNNNYFISNNVFFHFLTEYPANQFLKDEFSTRTQNTNFKNEFIKFIYTNIKIEHDKFLSVI